MRVEKAISDKRQKLIDELNASVVKVGEIVSVVLPDAYKKEAVSCKVLNRDGDTLLIKRSDSSINKSEYTIGVYEVVGRATGYVGANPFDETDDKVRPVAFTFESILFNLDILGDKHSDDTKFEKFKMNGIPVDDLNWNPFIYQNGKKEYYQRDFVWSLKDKQLLIESIYQGIDCGKLLVRKRGWKELEQMAANGETELAFSDIVDGKQRLNTVKEFILGEFMDLDGNFYSDLSAYSQHKFTDHQLFSYSELPDNTLDVSVIRQFLKLNFTGVQQSVEHIKFVKSLKSNKNEQ